MSFEKRKKDKSFRPTSKAFNKANKPPEGSAWLWILLDFLNSPAWLAAPSETKLFIIRLIQEQHAHAALENGNLKVTYDQLEQYGISRRHIKWAIECAIALGLVERTSRGWAKGKHKKCATYRLTDRPTILNNEPDFPTHDYKNIKTIEQGHSVLPPKSRRKITMPDKSNQCPVVTKPVSSGN